MASGEEACVDFTPERVAGLGLWQVLGDMGLSARYWTGRSGLEVILLAPSGGGRLWALGKALQRIRDTCYLDWYFAVSVGIPIGGSLDWQRFNFTLGLEFSLPNIREVTFIVEVGISILHYFYCDCTWYPCTCGWYWSAQGFPAFGIIYYF